MKLVTDRYRVEGAHPAGDGTPQRKVYRILGPSRAPGKVRIETWSHASKTWSLAHAEPEVDLVPAPEDWPQTRAARKALTGEAPRRRLS